MQPELQPNQQAPYQAGTATIAVEQQRVLRNTYLLLALTMVPTVAGAYLGIHTGGILMQHSFISFFVMLGAVIGLQFAIAANRNSGLGVVFLLLMTGLLGWFIGPLLNYALALKNGAQLVGYAAGGTALVFFGMATIASVTKLSPPRPGRSGPPRHPRAAGRPTACRPWHRAARAGRPP